MSADAKVWKEKGDNYWYGLHDGTCNHRNHYTMVNGGRLRLTAGRG